MKVLLICTQSPYPPNAGARLRTWGWMRAAAASTEVGVVTLVTSAEELHGLRQLRSVAGYVDGVLVRRSTARKARDLLRSIGARKPYLVQSAVDRHMAEAVRRAIREWKPDLVQAEMIGAAAYLPIARRSGLPSICSAHNLEARIVAGPRVGRPSRWVRTQAEWMRRREVEAAREASSVVAVTEEEASWFRRHARRVFVVPNAVDCEDYAFSRPSSRPRATIGFVGHLGYPPNRDAAVRLVREILPQIRRRHPAVRCLVAGRDPAPEVRRLAGDGVELAASVEDIREIWGRASLLVCPLRWGAGSRLKLLEAAACGVPIVATSMAAEGLALEPGRDFLQAEDAGGIADATASLLHDPGRSDALAERARRTVLEHHHWPRYGGRIRCLYDESISGHHGKERSAHH